jgi:2-methylcitrate dehydratase PrpD
VTGPAGRSTSPAGPVEKGLESALAAWIAGLAAADIPAAVADRVKDLLLDALASALVGRATVGTPGMEAAASALGGGGASTVIGGGRLSLGGATLVNGYEITAATICDVHRPILCHVTPVVVPPALAIAELDDADGATVLTALAAGFETTVRVGLALGYPRFRARGWHSPGVVGPFGGAAAVARLRTFDPTTTAHALGLAGSQSAGTFAALGSSQVKFHQARGALSGLLAALVAAEGFDAAPRFLAASDGGLLTTYSDGGDPGRLADGLGTTWELLGISLRRWPTASALQSVVQGALDLRGRLRADQLAGATVRVGLPEGSFRLNGGREWRDQLGAFQSAAYVASVVLTDGECWIDQFAPARIADPAIRRFVADQVEVRPDPSLPASGATLTIEDGAGTASTVRVDVPPGDPALPLSRADLMAKLRSAARGTPLAERVEQIAEFVFGLERERSVAPLLAALRVP